MSDNVQVHMDDNHNVDQLNKTTVDNGSEHKRSSSHKERSRKKKRSHSHSNERRRRQQRRRHKSKKRKRQSKRYNSSDSDTSDSERYSDSESDRESSEYGSCESESYKERRRQRRLRQKRRRSHSKKAKKSTDEKRSHKSKKYQNNEKEQQDLDVPGNPTKPSPSSFSENNSTEQASNSGKDVGTTVSGTISTVNDEPLLEPKVPTPMNDNEDDNDERKHRRAMMVPMTREQYEQQQSVVREVYDPQSGRMRLVRGTGEIIERIVSRDDHQRINQTATRGDGASFCKSVFGALSQRRR